MRPDDFCSSISVAIWIMMLLTRGRSSGRLLASSRMSPAIARGEKFSGYLDAMRAKAA